MHIQDKVSPETLLQYNIDVLQQVFGVNVSASAISSFGTTPFLDEAVVASLSFTNGANGRIWMSLEASQILALSAHLCERYQLSSHIDERAVFAELLNVYAANIATMLRRDDIELFITPPDTQWPPYGDAEGNYCFSVSMQTQEAFDFVFHYVFTE